eukprot:CAMPEP_0115015484 /NCGR_PEP_ID=MMETSP0216-20121206/26804_1 /TAXON_ID=223996 /ORGANISM="Protocruzia adherens, Strain Boccale" /LENGTH=188 /DNA_ID=CAMNT_0002385629 /DNA_START=20 /DNA_END=586 /DNA_ORIENTATION=+
MKLCIALIALICLSGVASARKVQHPIIIGDDSSDSSPCDVQEKQYYSLCHRASSCSSCAAIQKCGWCSESNACLPGTTELSACDSCNNKRWVFSAHSCEAPEPQDAMITTTTIHEGFVNKKVHSGYKVHREDAGTYKDPASGKIYHHEVDIAEPVYTTVRNPVKLVKQKVHHIDLQRGDIEVVGESEQ